MFGNDVHHKFKKKAQLFSCFQFNFFLNTIKQTQLLILASLAKIILLFYFKI